jgi:sensor histidine kinase regulating citrate/malate metabolism
MKEIYMSYIYKPRVNEIQEFIEIANDFANPLDIVREAISNSYDAHANMISMSFDAVKQAGETIFKIIINDNGNGMTEEDIKSFFDLGNSTRKHDIDAIGEKGHGTKVYFNSKKIIVTTCNGHKKIRAEVINPYNDLFDGKIPIVDITDPAI